MKTLSEIISLDLTQAIFYDKVDESEQAFAGSFRFNSTMVPKC